jgi:hypothetical protein
LDNDLHIAGGQGVHQGFVDTDQCKGFFFQIPPDLVVKLQPIDIVDITLKKILCMRFVSQRGIKG